MLQWPTKNDWHELYRDALLESDPAQVSVRIEQAHKVIQHRALELWYAGSAGTKERKELDAASYFLGLLRTIGRLEAQSSEVSKIGNRPD